MSIVPARRVCVLALVATSLLCAVPGTATAHVRAKYKAEYKRELGKMKAQFDGYAGAFSARQAATGAKAAEMKTMVGDPAKAKELRALEQSAGQAGQTLTDETMPEDWMQVETAFSAYLGSASRWFVSSRDRVRFTGAAATMKGTFSELVQDAAEDQSLAYSALSQDPPAVGEQAVSSALAAAHAAQAGRDLRKDVAALLALL
jgi:hypothetical protein